MIPLKDEQSLKLLKTLPVKVIKRGEKLYFDARFSRKLNEHLKLRMHGRWDPEYRQWWAPATKRTRFQLAYLAGMDPYKHYDVDENYRDDIREHCERRDLPVYTHQVDMINLMLNGRRVLIAGEMGVGKTMATMIAMEMSGCENPYWVGPKAPLESVKLDFKKWNSPVRPQFVTYNRVVKLSNSWSGHLPDFIAFDESSKLKNAKAQRTRAAMAIVEEMHEDAMVVELSGTPSPKKPTDWFAQIETICPGFIRECTPNKFRERLCHIKVGVGTEGHEFKQEGAWKTGPHICAECGEEESHWTHATEHQFRAGVNEVERLGKSLKGIVGVWLKKDCLDLPPMTFEQIRCVPSPETMQMAEAVAGAAGRGCDALIKLRTISDGFRYLEVDNGDRKDCEGCEAKGKVIRYIDPTAPHDPLSQNEIDSGFRYDGEDKVPITEITKETIDCYTCGGVGKVINYDREVEPVHSPKLDVLEALLEEHEEVGRLNVFAGFEGSILRIIERSIECGWNVLRVDGKGWKWIHPDKGEMKLTPEQMLQLYQKQLTDYPDRVVFVGQPGAAGMGLTLHAAPTTVFYSNDFNPESRIQACSRGHRIGMLQNGGKIIDLIHLPTDQKIIDSLNNSEKLQSISLQAVKESLNDSR